MALALPAFQFAGVCRDHRQLTIEQAFELVGFDREIRHQAVQVSLAKRQMEREVIAVGRSEIEERMAMDLAVVEYAQHICQRERVADPINPPGYAGQAIALPQERSPFNIKMRVVAGTGFLQIHDAVDSDRGRRGKTIWFERSGHFRPQRFQHRFLVQRADHVCQKKFFLGEII